MVNELKKALLNAKMDEEWPKITKDKDGRFKYASLEHILELVEPILGKHGLMVNFEPEERNGIEVMTTVLCHPESGTVALAESIVRPGKDDKEWGSSCTYQKRYGLMAILGVASSNDPDPDDATLPLITAEQVTALKAAITQQHPSKKAEVYNALLKEGRVTKLEDIYHNGFNEAIDFIRGYK